MANNCEFVFKVTGAEADVKHFQRKFLWEGEYEGKGYEYGFFFKCLYEDGTDELGQYYIILGGGCRWSIYSSFVTVSEQDLLEVSGELNLIIEGYSKEPGIGFQEHFLYCQGDSIIPLECVDYSEWSLYDFSEDWDNFPPVLESFARDMGTTAEHIREMAKEDGTFCLGGYGEDFCNFKTYKLR